MSPNPTDPATSRLTLSVLDFYLDRQARHVTEATMVWYRKYLGALETYLSGMGITDPAAVTGAHLRQWIVGLQGAGLAERTVHHHASAARAFFAFLVEDGQLAESPMRTVRMPKLPRNILPPFSTTEVERLLAAARRTRWADRDVAIVSFLLETGVRSAEFVNLDVGQVDLARGRVLIHGKGRKERFVYLGVKTRRALSRYLRRRQDLKQGDPLWVSERGERLTDSGLRQLLERLGHRAGVPNCHPHRFRRTCAKMSLRSGMNLFEVQRLLGHESLDMLRIYLELDDEDVEASQQAHSVVDGL